MRIFILGLRRSGTTIFWETFRSDPRLFCLDEPFNPLLRELPLEHEKRTRREFIEMFRRDPDRFWKAYAPIGRIEELQEDLHDRQLGYLRFLLDSAEHVVLDTTRCHFKIRSLHHVAPDAILVHLYRPAVAFASSHAAPTSKGWLGRAKTLYDRHRFFHRPDRYGAWGIEELIGNSPQSLFGLRLRTAGMEPSRIYEMPAPGRLLAYWWLHFREIEEQGARIFGDRFLSVRFDDFCRDPASVVSSIYRTAGVPEPKLEFDAIHPPNRGYRPQDRRWSILAQRVGIPGDTGLLV